MAASLTNVVSVGAAIPVLIEIIKSSDSTVTLSIKEQAMRLTCHMCYNNSKNQVLHHVPWDDQRWLLMMPNRSLWARPSR